MSGLWSWLKAAKKVALSTVPIVQLLFPLTEWLPRSSNDKPVSGHPF